jgi:hypothetical protein
MAHPYHTNEPGRLGGSNPKIQNDLLKACSASFAEMQQKRADMSKKLPNPVSRLKK